MKCNLTAHAIQRIKQRTSLTPQEFLDLMQRRVFVELGAHDDIAYLLFYDVRERDYNVAIIDTLDLFVISVWKADFKLPSQLAPITWKQRRLARHRALILAATVHAEPRYEVWLCLSIREEKPFHTRKFEDFRLNSCASLDVAYSHYFPEIIKVHEKISLLLTVSDLHSVIYNLILLQETKRGRRVEARRFKKNTP